MAQTILRCTAALQSLWQSLIFFCGNDGLRGRLGPAIFWACRSRREMRRAMDWQLAKELRDEGFPQRPPYVVNPDDPGDRAAVPDLLQLYDACQGVLRCVLPAGDGWIAIGPWIGEGKDLAEAVARLWLLHAGCSGSVKPSPGRARGGGARRRRTPKRSR